jgi:hypothetical protein
VLFSLVVEHACRIGAACLVRLQAEVSGHCGVTRFEFSYGDYGGDKERRKADPDHRPSRAVTFTELDGNEKLRVMRNINMSNVFHSREGVDVDVRQQIWSGFGDIYTHLSSWDSEFSPVEFQACAITGWRLSSPPQTSTPAILMMVSIVSRLQMATRCG